MTNVDSCGGISTLLAGYATSYRAACWKHVSNGLVPCNQNGIYCTMTCTMCFNPGGFIQNDNCTFQLTGTPN